MAGRKSYLDPDLLSRLGNIDLVARCAVEGFYAGLHPSPFHGFSVEYSDHRSYEPGDELRFLDWKIFGRSDKLYIKQFQQETNVPVYILLDSSMSMTFSGEGKLSKLDYGSYLAAALSYLMLGQGDAVGLTTFSETIRARVPSKSRRTHLYTILTALQENQASGKTRLADVLHTVAETTHRRGLVVLISDLIDDAEDLHTGLTHLRFLNHDVILFQTLDHQELRLDYEGLIEFIDLESSTRIRTFTNSLRESYCEKVANFVETVEKKSREVGIDYCLLDTSQPLDKAFLAYLAKRKRLG